MENNLYSLCKKFNTDKLELGYVELYESYFKPLREKKLNILEIGVLKVHQLKFGRNILLIRLLLELILIKLMKKFLIQIKKISKFTKALNLIKTF